mgnify:CR=1 FL=1
MKSSIKNNVIRGYDNQHFLHPWQDCRSDSSEYKMIKKSDGIYLFDESGKKYIDGPGGMWCVNLGYGRKDIAQEILDYRKKTTGNDSSGGPNSSGEGSSSTFENEGINWVTGQSS